MRHFKLLFLCVVLCFASTFSYALVALPAIFGDNMVFQQKTKVKIWGWAKPYEEIKVTVGWDTTTYKVMTGNTMTWEVEISTPEASFTPYEITVEGWRKLTLKNVLIGEVWLCSGQSNMEWSPRNGIKNGDAEIAAANYPNIRFFQVVPRKSETPQDDLYGVWTECSPETMIDFSAIGYFFARDLQKELNCPIGIINSSVGGSPIEVWLPTYKGKNEVFTPASSQYLPEMSWCPITPGCLYNAMIHPITNFKVKGFLWYQGEANEPNSEFYFSNLERLITLWRENWIHDANEQMPFYYAQIAPYNYGTKNACPAIQYAQLCIQSNVENSAMIITNDFVDDVNNIHPKDKQTAAHRFANFALSETYGHKMEHNALFCPWAYYTKMVNNDVLLRFENVKDLHSTTKTIDGFEIAGKDEVFYPAKATIIKDKETGAYSCVALRCSKVKEPKQVRYAWSNTAQPSLRNECNLPSSCFWDLIGSGDDKVIMIDLMRETENE